MPGRFESILFSIIVGECNIINPDIKTHISPDGHTLYILDIPEEDIGKLSFPTNTDNNNNKLTLVNAFVSLVSNPLRTITIPGFADQMIYAFNDSNSRGFRNLDVIHKPFAALPAGFYSPSKPTLTPSILADTLAGITTFTQPTRGSPKYFGLTLTNDDTQEECVQTCSNNLNTCNNTCWTTTNSCVIGCNGDNNCINNCTVNSSNCYTNCNNTYYGCNDGCD
jgi:hypothetical protein